jgi:hypothetical protein
MQAKDWAFCCTAYVRFWHGPLLGVERTSDEAAGFIGVTRLTQSGHEAPLFVATHITDPARICYNYFLILALG